MDESDDLTGVLVVAAPVAVAFQDVEDLDDEVPGQAFVVGHAPLLFCWSAGGWMSGAVPVPVAGFQP